MMPFSYNGFGSAAIIIMVAIVAASQAFRYVKNRFMKHH